MKDLTYALRFLRNRWFFSSVAVVVMALGISLTATMFAIIEGVILNGPDYEELDRIAFLRTTQPQSQFFQGVRLHDYADWREQQAVFDEMRMQYTLAFTPRPSRRGKRFQPIQVRVRDRSLKVRARRGWLAAP